MSLWLPCGLHGFAVPNTVIVTQYILSHALLPCIMQVAHCQKIVLKSSTRPPSAGTGQGAPAQASGLVCGLLSKLWLPAAASDKLSVAVSCAV
jgi:hypothetical protein